MNQPLLLQNQKNKWIVVLSALLLFIIGCEQGRPTGHYRWSIHDQEAPPSELTKFLKTHSKASSTEALDVGEESVEFLPQRIGGLEVENSYVQTVKNRNGEMAYAVASNTASLSPQLITELRALAEAAPQFLKNVQANYPGLKKAKKVFPPTLYLAETQEGLRPYLRMRFIPETGDDVLQFTKDANGTVLALDRVAHHNASGVTSVFEKTPKEARNESVTLSELKGDGRLHSRWLQVSSDDGPSAFNKDHDFRYSLSAPYFAEAQVFYYIQKFFIELEQNNNFTLPMKLDVKVHMGGVGKSNVAFYYRGNIRLGDGDGIVYKNMYRDPTIVMHEAAHAVVDTLARLPQSGDGGSLNEGFADFLAAAANDTPFMGGSYSYQVAPYRRSLENNLNVMDRNNGLYHDSTIVSGTLWDIKKTLGKNKTVNLVLATLIRLGPAAYFEDFSSAIVDACKALKYNESQRNLVRNLLKQRGWPDVPTS